MPTPTRWPATLGVRNLAAPAPGFPTPTHTSSEPHRRHALIRTNLVLLCLGTDLSDVANDLVTGDHGVVVGGRRLPAVARLVKVYGKRSVSSLIASVAGRRTGGADAAVRDLDLDVLGTERAGVVLEGLERYALAEMSKGVARAEQLGLWVWRVINLRVRCVSGELGALVDGRVDGGHQGGLWRRRGEVGTELYRGL